LFLWEKEPVVRRNWSSLAIVLVVALAARAEEKPKDKKAAELPVQAKLVAKKASYPLDLGGKTPAEYKKALEETDLGKLPPPVKVEMALEVTNTSDKDVAVWVSGTPVTMNLELKGPGAVVVTPRQFFPAIFILPKPVVLAPGKSHSFPLSALTYGRRGVAHRAYWTEPGDYTLRASLMTAISPAPRDVKADKDGFGPVTLTSEPIKIKVEAK
jgi:hypothetical protein